MRCIALHIFQLHTWHSAKQWRTQKIFMGGLRSVAYGGHLYLMCAVCDVTILTSYSCFQANVLVKFVDTTCIFFYIHSPYFMFHCTAYKPSVLQVRLSEENKLNATTQQFITANMSGCVLKQGSKTHSSMSQSNSQLQNEAVLMSC